MKFTAQQLIEKRENLAREKNYSIVKVFDTLEKTSGEKDVALCKTDRGELVILRIGEIRPPNFFANGFTGNTLVIPKIYESYKEDIIYEIEEYLEGDLIFDLDIKNHLLGKVDDKILEKIIACFWEFQIIAKDIGLKDKFEKQKILDHFAKASPLLKSPQLAKKIIDENEEFWQEPYPSKWKFATDNLVLLGNGKIGLIDNGRVGLRNFGYDLGWVIWPRWVEMETAQYDKIEEHLLYLENFMKLTKELKPKEIKIDDFEKKFWLMIFQRVIGAIFDVANDTRHLVFWHIGPQGDKERTQKHLYFLNTLLENVMDKLKI